MAQPTYMKNLEVFKSDNYKRITRYSLAAIPLLGTLLFYILHRLEVPFGVTEIIAFGTACVALLTLINFSRNIDIIQNHHLKSLEISKNQYSFNIVAESHKDYIARSFKAFRELDKKLDLAKLPIDKLLAFLEENQNLESEIVQVLNYFEHISLLIKKNHVDEEIIKDSFKTLFIRVYALTRNFIHHSQTQKSHTIWSEFVSTAKKWSNN
jgi:hypothetical protein